MLQPAPMIPLLSIQAPASHSQSWCWLCTVLAVRVYVSSCTIFKGRKGYAHNFTTSRLRKSSALSGKYLPRSESELAATPFGGFPGAVGTHSPGVTNCPHTDREDVLIRCSVHSRTRVYLCMLLCEDAVSPGHAWIINPFFRKTYI